MVKTEVVYLMHRHFSDVDSEALAAADISRCHIFVYTRNTEGQGFWHAIGWKLRADLAVMSRETRPEG